MKLYDKAYDDDVGVRIRVEGTIKRKKAEVDSPRTLPLPSSTRSACTAISNKL